MSWLNFTVYIVCFFCVFFVAFCLFGCFCTYFLRGSFLCKLKKYINCYRWYHRKVMESDIKNAKIKHCILRLYALELLGIVPCFIPYRYDQYNFWNLNNVFDVENFLIIQIRPQKDDLKTIFRRKSVIKTKIKKAMFHFLTATL